MGRSMEGQGVSERRNSPLVNIKAAVQWMNENIPWKPNLEQITDPLAPKNIYELIAPAAYTVCYGLSIEDFSLAVFGIVWGALLVGTNEIGASMTQKLWQEYYQERVNETTSMLKSHKINK